MKIIVDIPEDIIDTINDDQFISREQLAVLQKHIMDGAAYFESASTVEPDKELMEKVEQYKTAYKIMADAFEGEVKKVMKLTRPHGEWVDNVFIGGYVCNNCNAGYNTNPKSPFCPICGAWMKNGQIPEAVARRAIKTKKDGQADE